MTLSLPDPRAEDNVRPGTWRTDRPAGPPEAAPSVGLRLAAAAIAETRRELALFAAREPEFKAWIVAVVSGRGGFLLTDLAATAYDCDGLAHLLHLLEGLLVATGEPIRVYGPLESPVEYEDALALIVARLRALQDRLDAYIDQADDGDAALPALRAAAWAIDEVRVLNEGGVSARDFERGEALLATALSAEATAWDEDGDKDETDAEEVVTARSGDHADAVSR